MDIRQLRYFIAIAEEKQITAASKRLHMTQPPLSQQLGSMEQELGVDLFSRKGRYLELTDAGEALYRNAINIINLMGEMDIEVKEVGVGMRGKLLMGINTLSHYDLGDLLERFNKMYPQITYKIQQNESGQLCKLLKERVIELAIVRFPIELKDFSVLYFKPESFYFVVSSEISINSENISYEQMQDYSLILPSTEGLGLFNMIIERFTSRSLKANVICECSDILTLLDLVSRGFGATIIPETILKTHKGYKLKSYKIADDNFKSHSGLIWLKDRYLSKSSQNFIELLKERYS